MPRARSLRLLLASSLLFLPTVLVGCEDGEQRTETHNFSEDIVEIDAHTGSGDIFVSTHPSCTAIEVRAVIQGSETEVEASVNEGVLELDSRCPNPWHNCAIDWYIQLPETLPSFQRMVLDTGSGDVFVEGVEAMVEANTGSGNIDLLGVDAAHLSLGTGSGNIELRAVEGQHVELETGSGDVLAQACALDHIEGHTGSGDARLDLRTAPDRVDFETGSGTIELDLPTETYALELDTGSGEIEVEGIVGDANADRSIDLSTGSGDVLIHGT